MKQTRIVALVHSDTDTVGGLDEVFAQQRLALEVRSITRPLVDPADLDCLLVMGSPESAFDERLAWLGEELSWLRAVLQRGVPTMGICFGSQILARALGGRAFRNAQVEIGWTPLDTSMSGWTHPGPWLNFHFDTFTLPPGTALLGKTDLALQAYRTNTALGVQFHPEINAEMFRAWLRYWRTTDAGRSFLASAGDLPERMLEEIHQREAENLRNCSRLIQEFLGFRRLASSRVPLEDIQQE